jgi:hypothetical protein
MKFVFMLFSAIFCSQAMAYAPGLYTCKNSEAGLPADTYQISNTWIGSVNAPFVEMTRHYRQDPSDPKSEVVTTSIKGFATVSSSGTTEIFMVGQAHMEFDNGTLFGCTPP